jgi:ribosomal protein S18 acetylase RimI-like enzyme
VVIVDSSRRAPVFQPCAPDTIALVTTPTIRAASAADLPAATAVLAEAFEHDPMLARVIRPSADRRRERLALLFTTLLRSAPKGAQIVDAAQIGQGIVGAAVWERPSAPQPTVLGELPHLPAFARAIGLAGIVPATIDQRRMAAARPRQPHWYLGEIGVGEAVRGRGVGAALLLRGLARADADGVDAYLESSTPRNRALYARHGFVELGPVPGMRGAGVPVRMLRSASAR